MSDFIREFAEKLNQQHADAVHAELERERASQHQTRVLSYYAEFGNGWFRELVSEVDKAIAEFNGITGDHSKFERTELGNSEGDVVVVEFSRNATGHQSPPKCIVERDKLRTEGTVAVQNVKQPSKDRFEIHVKNFSSFEIRVFANSESTQLGEGVEWKDRVTGETHYEPNFYTKKTTSRFVFGTKDFANYILTFFARKVLESSPSIQRPVTA